MCLRRLLVLVRLPWLASSEIGKRIGGDSVQAREHFSFHASVTKTERPTL